MNEGMGRDLGEERDVESLHVLWGRDLVNMVECGRQNRVNGSSVGYILWRRGTRHCGVVQ